MAAPAAHDDDRPNILLIVSDQERQRDWIPRGLTLPHRQRLIDEGLEFRRYYTHSSPCSPSRASLFTGRYLPQHGVHDNVIFPAQPELDPAIPTLGTLLRDSGYRTSYVGKWHLSHAVQPDLEQYGFSDWGGNDRHFMGWAGTGWQFDPVITDQAVRWLDANAASIRQPWFLVVALVNPHDVMWFPIDQPSYQEANPEEFARTRAFLAAAAWKEDEPIPAFTEPYDEVFDELPANFDDDLSTKPAVHRQWLHEQQHTLFGTIDPDDTRAWFRQLDYYWRLHQAGDHNLGRILHALDASGRAEDTAVIFTSDHGDMCGSHGLRSKGPFVYEEIMRVPLYIHVPGGTTPGTTTDALATHVDLARTIGAIAGIGDPALPGHDLMPVLRDPTQHGRDSILLAQDQAWYASCVGLRYAMRGIVDGRFKYARYYGVGGGFDHVGRPCATPKEVGVDADFDDQEHELYDLQEDPYELVNLARDGGRRSEVREWFGRLRAEEAREFAVVPQA